MKMAAADLISFPDWEYLVIQDRAEALKSPDALTCLEDTTLQLITQTRSTLLHSFNLLMPDSYRYGMHRNWEKHLEICKTT